MNKRRPQNRNWSKSNVELIRDGILQYGFLSFVFRQIGKFLKSAWCLAIFRKKKKRKPENPMKKIYQKWEENWLADESDKIKAKEDPFFLLFKFDYEYSCQKAVENKKKNFLVKFFCILPFLIVTVLYMVGVFAYNLNVLIEVDWKFGEFLEKNNWDFSIYGTVFYIAAVLLTYATSKWLDVKQYQETWCRHSDHKYAVEMEMLKYISFMNEYYYNDRKQKFKKNIMKTWDKNQKKFIENMKKEKDMGMNDLLEHIKGKAD